MKTIWKNTMILYKWKGLSWRRDTWVWITFLVYPGSALNQLKPCFDWWLWLPSCHLDGIISEFWTRTKLFAIWLCPSNTPPPDFFPIPNNPQEICTWIPEAGPELEWGWSSGWRWGNWPIALLEFTGHCTGIFIILIALECGLIILNLLQNKNMWEAPRA